MDLVEHHGKLLNFVQYDQLVSRLQFLPQAGRPVAERPKDVSIKEIVDLCTRQRVFEQCGLARLPRPEQEERFSLRQRRQIERAWDIFSSHISRLSCQ